jgi:peroxiredoxin Q/BCP
VLVTGSVAPSFEVPDQFDRPFALEAYRGRTLLVYFYPKADTPGCTEQSCGLRDVKSRIGGALIVGISPDAPARQRKFDEKFGFGFPLLADTDNSIARAWGVWKKKSMYGREYMGIERSAFLVGPDGRILHAWYKISPKDTPLRLLEALAA